MLLPAQLGAMALPGRWQCPNPVSKPPCDPDPLFRIINSLAARSVGKSAALVTVSGTNAIKAGESMLRVEIHDASNTTLLRVEGRFAAQFAEEMRTMIVRCKLPTKLVVDLSDVTFVDRAGEEVLLWLGHIGSQFVADTCYALDICERLHLPLNKRYARRSRCVVR